MKNLKLVAIMVMSFISLTSMAQDSEVANLKNSTIKGFLSALDGTEEAAEKAVNKFGSQEVVENGMIPFGSNIKIISETDNCVTFKSFWIIDENDAEEGTEIMYYDICEEGGVITSFDLNLDIEEE